MFRKMRRAEKKSIPNEETIRLLQESKRGVLAVAEGDNTQYFLDENRDYVVPKRKPEDIVTYL